PWDWPVECNYLEALAFSRFQSEKFGKILVLPNEEEYLYMRYQTELFRTEDEQKFKSKSLVQLPIGNLGLRHVSSCPVDKYAFSFKYDQMVNFSSTKEKIFSLSDETIEKKLSHPAKIYDVSGN